MEVYFSFFSSFFVIIMTLFLIIFILLTMHSIIPFKMDEEWEKEDIPTDCFFEYLKYSFSKIVILTVIIVLGLIFLFLESKEFFINSFIANFISVFYYAIFFVTILAFASIIGIISYFKMPGQICYVITVILFAFILILTFF